MTFEARFKTPADAAAYLAAYEAVMAEWPVPHEERQISTPAGMTHVNVTGPADAPPLVLLHGAQISSAMWAANVGPLSDHFRVYAPDGVDQAGRSVPLRKLATPQESAAWLTDLLDALGIDRATIVGHSVGCWQTLNLARFAPDRIARIVLLAPPPPLAPLRWWMFLRMLPVFVRPTRQMFYRSLQWLTTLPLNPDQPHPLFELFIIGATRFQPQELGLGVFGGFADDDLRRIDQPTLLLIGEHERVVSVRRVLDRARLLPNVTAEVIPGAAHFLPVDQPEITNARMLDFLLQN